MARSITINVKQNSIDLDKLSEIQNNTDELSFSMMKYIEKIIKNEKAVKEYCKLQFDTLRKKQHSGIHGRTNESINLLHIGFCLFTSFLQDYNVIEPNKKTELDNKCYETLLSIIEQQNQELEELKPTEMFYDALEQLLTSKAIRVLNYPNGFDFIGYSGGKMVGYYDQKDKLYYFLPTVLYNEIQAFYNNKFPINAKSLWKYLDEERKLISYRQKKVHNTANYKKTVYNSCCYKSTK